MKTPVQKVLEIINKISYLNLATVSKEGVPWNTALWYAKDNEFNFYFVSPKNTVHATNIVNNGLGFVTIYDSTAPEGDGIGVFMNVRVEEVHDMKEIIHAIKYLYKAKKNKRQSTEFLSKAPRRIYKITPLKIWINDAKEEKGLYLDYRVEIPISDFIDPK